MKLPRTRVPRGNALLLTVIAIAVLMVLVGGAIQFTNRNREASAEKLRGDRVNVCAEAARRHLLSRLSLFQATGSLQILDTRLIDDPDPDARSRMTTGHYGNDTAVATVKTVDAVTMGAAGRQARDMANAAPSSATLGGQYYRVVVKCEESSGGGRESEVEFLFRYGL
ncbi:hypothetical protein F0U60_39305 [Archangium minus]|uniref:Type IV fimbrial biogenesis protein PilX n=1 Tax=Archangium minus TaxID=83450 RepID=A0ABY9X275_9BACT|nr:hypothetical protein F0U61_38935 [Archangium violaceum]WNG49498.1 hypothetical protein F0U60_39305 [Archangium minus]